MHLHEKAKPQSSKRFSQPENFECVKEGSGWKLYVGGNDWEDSATAMAVVFPGDETIKRLWACIKFPRGLEGKVQKGELKRDRRSEAVKHADRAWHAWVRVARACRKDPEQEWPKNWYEAFKDALAKPEVSKFISDWGEDRTEWRSTAKPDAVVEALIGARIAL